MTPMLNDGSKSGSMLTAIWPDSMLSRSLMGIVTLRGERPYTALRPKTTWFPGGAFLRAATSSGVRFGLTSTDIRVPFLSTARAAHDALVRAAVTVEQRMVASGACQWDADAGCLGLPYIHPIPSELRLRLR